MTVMGVCAIGCVIQLGVSVGPAHVGIPTAVDVSPVGLLSHAQHGLVSLPQEVPIEETYRRQCAACHGPQGRGDGRMARRFKPPPADFRDPEGVAKRSDEELMQVILEGRASMPAFGDVLTEEAVTVLINYVRDLGRGVVPQG